MVINGGLMVTSGGLMVIYPLENSHFAKCEKPYIGHVQ